MYLVHVIFLIYITDIFQDIEVDEHQPRMLEEIDNINVRVQSFFIISSQISITLIFQDCQYCQETPYFTSHP